MNQKEKSQLNQWMRSQKFSMRDGGQLFLDDLIKDSRNKFNNPTDLVIPRLMEACHPWLYFNFVIDWSKLPQAKIPVSYRDGSAFGMAIIKDWQAYCGRTKMFRSGLLEHYVNIDQLRLNTNKLLAAHKSQFYISDGIRYMEEQLCLMREADMSREQEEAARRKEEEDAERAEQEAKQSERESEALRRQQKEKEQRMQEKQSHQQTAAYNAAFHDKDGSPWTAEPDISASESADVARGSSFGSSISFNEFEARIRTLHHELSIYYGYNVSISIGYQGNEYILCCDARNGNTELAAADLLKYYDGEHISECLSQAQNQLDTLREQARVAAEQAKKKSEMEEKLKKLLAEADSLRAAIKSM